MKTVEEIEKELEYLHSEIYEYSVGSVEWLRVFHRITALKWVLGKN